MSESRVRDLYANATAWNFGDHEDRPELARMREAHYAEFDRFIAKVRDEAKVDALREAAAGFIDWDALRGDVSVTPEIEESHKSANYLMREADRIEGEA